MAVAANAWVWPITKLADEGLTLTVATGATLIFITAVAVFPSTEAVTVAVPKLTPVTTPPADTVATLALLELQTTGRPVRIAPLASRAITVKARVWPTSRLPVAGDTATVATAGGKTEIDTVPDLPSAVAEIVAVPIPTAVTKPASVTVATV